MKNLKILSLVMALALAMGLLAGCGNSSTQPQVENGSSTTTGMVPDDEVVHSTLHVTYKDGTTKEFALECNAGDTLATAMLNAELISAEEAEAGFVTVLDGVATDFNKDQSWWQLLDGEGLPCMVGCADILLEEGESYSFVYTVG